MFTGQKIDASDIKEHLKKSKNTSVFSHVKLAFNGNPKTIIIIGTRHGEPCMQEIGQLLNEFGNDSYSIILEKPSIHDLQLDFYPEELLKRSGQDKTQDDLAQRHAQFLKLRGVTVIGADGRKMFSSEKNSTMDISLAYKKINRDYFLKADEIIVGLPSGKLIQLAIGIIDSCLSQNSVNLNEMINLLSEFIEYTDGTDPRKILTSLFNRIKVLDKQLSQQDKSLIRDHLINDIQENIRIIFEKINDNFSLDLEEYKYYLEFRKKEMETCIASFSDEMLATSSIEVLLEKRGYDSDDMMLLYSMEEKLLDYSIKLKQQSCHELLDEVFIRACCDLRLYAELLCNPKEIIVIVFGNNHIRLLEKFIISLNLHLKVANDHLMSDVKGSGESFKLFYNQDKPIHQNDSSLTPKILIK